MNGDTKVLYDAIVDNGSRITSLEVSQKMQHKQNSEDIKKLIEHDEMCLEGHIKAKTHIQIQWWFIGGIVFGIMGVAWAALK